MNCRRCGTLVGADGIQVWVAVPPPDCRTYYLDGDQLGSIAAYHQRCLPSNLFHKFTGSLPVGQSPADASLRKEHAIGGGLSSKRRKRPARRIRYKRTAARRQRESVERQERQQEAAMAVTIQDVLNRGGKPGLCHCRVFSSSDTYFITTHGHCRYCGGWTPEIFRDALGDDALRQAIDELDLHHRTEMIRLTATTA